MPRNDNILARIAAVPLTVALQDPPPLEDAKLSSWLFELRQAVDENSETMRQSITALSRYVANPQGTITAASYAATDDDYLILADATAGAITITLPPAASLLHHDFIVKRLNSGSNDVIIDGNSSETIDGSTTFTLTVQHDAIRIVSDGTGWWIY